MSPASTVDQVQAAKSRESQPKTRGPNPFADAARRIAEGFATSPNSGRAAPLDSGLTALAMVAGYSTASPPTRLNCATSWRSAPTPPGRKTLCAPPSGSI